MGASSLNDKAMSRLRTLVNGGHAAVLTMELQEGVVGREALMQSLVEAVDAGGLRRIAGEVCAEARRRNVSVVHCVAGVPIG
ncbi:MAG: hypothetical protein ACKOBT_02190 [Actinomycetota bacterium]